MKRLLLFSLLLFSFTSCSRERLYIQNNYLTHNDLASTHVGSPDPRKEDNWMGQRLIVGWAVPKEYLQKERIRLSLRLRYGSRDEEEVVIPLKKRRGTYIFDLLNDDYREKRGIITYQARVMAGADEVLETWTHQVWAEMISVKE